MALRNAFRSETVMVRTPDGTMFTNIMEDKKGNPFQIQINIGKAGHSVSAWSFAMAELCSAYLQKGGTINELIAMLSGITTNKYLRNIDGAVCRSGPEGLVITLLKYRDGKFADVARSIEINDENAYYRPPQLNVSAIQDVQP